MIKVFVGDEVLINKQDPKTKYIVTALFNDSRKAWIESRDGNKEELLLINISKLMVTNRNQLSIWR